MARKESEMDNKVVTTVKRRPPAAGMGRIKGVPNKTTQNVREMIAMVAEQNASKFAEWLERVAEGDAKTKPDPGRAAELYLKAIEYHIPKLARTEVSGSNGTPLEMVISWANEK